MKGLEFWGIEHGGAAAARSCQVSSRRIRSSQARLKTTPDATGNQIFKSCREVRRAKRWNRVTSRAQVPVLVSAMAEETIQQAERKPRIFHALGTAVPSAPAAVPDDPALPGLALLHRPEQFLAAFTPLLRNRLGSRIELTHGRLFVHRHIPGKRCIVKVEATTRTAPGMPDEPQCFFVKLYTGGHGARVYKNCQQLWRIGFSQGRFTMEGDRFTGLDFDEFRQYHPLFDVAHFVAHLRFLALTSLGSINALESADFSVSRLHLFTGIAYLKLAYVEAAVRHNRDGKQVTDALLAEARRFAESEN